MTETAPGSPCAPKKAARAVESKVSKSRARDETPAPVKRLNSADFPALVQPTSAAVKRLSRRRRRRANARLAAMAASRFSSLRTFAASKRRSISICFSPGPPRKPMPPRWRSKCVHPRTSRVRLRFAAANSTCSRPSKVVARRAKISKINSVRSMMRQPTAFSRLRVCAGAISRLNNTASACNSSRRRAISSALPPPTKVAACCAGLPRGDGGDDSHFVGARQFVDFIERARDFGFARRAEKRGDGDDAPAVGGGRGGFVFHSPGANGLSPTTKETRGQTPTKPNSRPNARAKKRR